MQQEAKSMEEWNPRKRETSKSVTMKTSYVDYDYLIKVVIVGDSGVGKSQLVARFTRNEFSTNSRQTIGVEFATKTIAVSGKQICAQLWDTAGEERYRALASAYYRGAAGVLLVYDVTNSRSFKNLVHWLSEIKAYAMHACQIILVGNKIDLQAIRKVPTNQAKAFAESNKISYTETSALECTNVEASFTSLVSHIYFNTILQNPAGRDDACTTINPHTNGELRIKQDERKAGKIKTKCCGAMG